MLLNKSYRVADCWEIRSLSLVCGVLSAAHVIAADNWPPPPPVSPYYAEAPMSAAPHVSRYDYADTLKEPVKRRSPWDLGLHQRSEPVQQTAPSIETRRLNPWSSGGAVSGYGNYPPIDLNPNRDTKRRDLRPERGRNVDQPLWSDWSNHSDQSRSYRDNYAQPLAPGWDRSSYPSGIAPLGLGGMPNIGNMGWPNIGFPF